ncbi:DUF1002 domain-containing protein [Limosilactobacillus ingluviei]|uniref:Extracellular protein n=1 Tax=Limosilactobacillus ingluviei TaxID=148604 RepID=A0A0R2GXG9_9LACO|nr:DUF1002 domain-containing protein [Limosilactobacillus ingluviei]KRN45474.1 hypothetical protein IV41_GL000690 [Limosilactobacillus ingluviei]MBM6728278.1 DUF1002 domain-containing protein [Limosilactobacillus ingluviei]MDO4603015.1 DUF1002 domain-containing protein [Limosilactobacillus ingluviei]
MKNTKRTLAIVLTAAIVATAAGPVSQALVLPTPVQAAQTGSSQQTASLNQAYVVYGAGAPQSVYANLNDVMDVDSSFTKLTATGQDYATYISHGAPATDASMISSVAIAPTDPGSGVKVNVKKYNGQSNITKVTAQQYAMVAQMAGVTDITITVTANRAVSGESALTGVYKAFAADGHQLDTQNTAAANSVLTATQAAIDANSDDQAYAGKLMAAVGDTSKQVAQEKQKGNNLTKVQIEVILKQALEKRGVADQTTANQQSQIAGSLVNFQNSPIASSKTYVTNVTNTINNVKNSTGDLMNKAKNWLNSDSGKQAANQASNWFQRLVNWVKGLFQQN